MAQHSTRIEFADVTDSAGIYQAEWHAFAVRHHLALFLLCSWIPACYGMFWLSRHYVHRPVASLSAMGLWLACAFAAVWWAGEFRCPRCRRRYAALGYRKGDTNLTRGVFDKVCANCKLKKFENG
jgi:hypothetical protein